MAKNKILSTLLLYPISVVYGWVVAMRNMMFDHGILSVREFQVPVITVGNISMGGSGKTPHTEYLVSHLSDDHKVAVLSRGYKRKTKGFVLASDHSHVDDIGDEPYQIYHKFSDRKVLTAVCEKRVKGIEGILEVQPDTDMVVLDDAFQHRYVKPTLSVVLMEYARPAYFDELLPYGRLREPITALNRADIVVVTKTPANMKPMEKRLVEQRLNLFPYQRLLFSTYRYLEMKPLFEEAPPVAFAELGAKDAALAVTGVANPRPFIKHLRVNGLKVKIKMFGDHHHFTHSDMQAILDKFKSIPTERKFVITTEKDAMRLLTNPYFPHQLKKHTYYIPIEVDFDTFNDHDLNHEVRDLLRNGSTITRQSNHITK